MSQHAYYHQEGKQPVRLRVVKNEGGLLDLASLESDVVVVSDCPVGERPGMATLIEEADKTAEKEAQPVDQAPALNLLEQPVEEADKAAEKPAAVASMTRGRR